MDTMVRTVHLIVTTNVMVVTTLTVSVIEDVNQAGWDTNVNKVMYLHYTLLLCFYKNTIVYIYN